MVSALDVWEDDGGTAAAKVIAFRGPLEGTPSQVEWADRIRKLVGEEFDRVADTFRSVAAKQRGSRLSGTEAILAILEEKREVVMSRPQAGYFIHDWQEISDQVRRMIGEDVRFQAIKAERTKLTN